MVSLLFMYTSYQSISKLEFKMIGQFHLFILQGQCSLINSKITVNEPELAQQANLHLLSLANTLVIGCQI